MKRPAFAEGVSAGQTPKRIVSRTIWTPKLGWPFGAKKVKRVSKRNKLRQLPAAPF